MLVNVCRLAATDVVLLLLLVSLIENEHNEQIMKKPKYWLHQLFIMSFKIIEIMILKNKFAPTYPRLSKGNLESRSRYEMFLFYQEL